MQRLEVSGAVRPIYGSLGVKRLMMLWGPETKLRDPECVELRFRTQWRGERCKFIFNFINSLLGYNPNTYK